MYHTPNIAFKTVLWIRFISIPDFIIKIVKHRSKRPSDPFCSLLLSHYVPETLTCTLGTPSALLSVPQPHPRCCLDNRLFHHCLQSWCKLYRAQDGVIHPHNCGSFRSPSSSWSRNILFFFFFSIQCCILNPRTSFHNHEETQFRWYSSHAVHLSFSLLYFGAVFFYGNPFILSWSMVQYWISHHDFRLYPSLLSHSSQKMLIHFVWYKHRQHRKSGCYFGDELRWVHMLLLETFPYLIITFRSLVTPWVRFWANI